MSGFSRSRATRPAVAVLLVVVLSALGLVSGCSLLQGAAAPVCREVSVPVSLPTGEHGVLAGTYCHPARSSPTTVAFEVHGGTYNRDYFQWSGDGDEYNFTARAVGAGYATLAIDRLGDGQSLRPISMHDTSAAQVSTLHQVIQAVRGGHLGVVYQHLLWIGHSFGSYYGISVAAQYPHDVDALLLTGFGAHVSKETTTIDNADMAPARELVRYRAQYPAYARFAGLDPGYITNKPDTRADQLADGPDHQPPNEDPDVIAADQASEDVLSQSELTTRPANLGALLAHVPNVPLLV